MMLSQLFSGGISSMLNPSQLLTKAIGFVGLDPYVEFFSSAQKLMSDINSINKTEVIGVNLKDVSLQTSTYSRIIPEIFGNVRIAGNIIWSSDIIETKIQHGYTVSKGEVREPYVEKKVRVSFAIAICKGIVDEIKAIYADNEALNQSNYSIEIYYGTDDQMPSPTIQSFLGYDQTPAFRDLCYVVFSSFPLEEFNNRLPNFTFDISRKEDIKNDNEKPEDLVTCMTIIPGSGEFVYDTVTQKQFNGNWKFGIFTPTSKATILNNMTVTPETNSVDSLNDLLKTFKNIKWISLVVSWFGNNLDCEYCSIYPACENSQTITSPDEWSVGEYRKSVQNVIEVGKDSKGNVRYGGTPSDLSVIRFVKEIKKRGIKVMIYPMLMMDVDQKPWRGRLTTNNIDVIEYFFNKSDGYNNFIKHYAELLKNDIDGIIIGSEMIGMTKLKSFDNQFPAVNEFCKLAENVKNIVGSSKIVTYAADWSEYHHTDGGYYNMDKLWANKSIDVIGIDAYFPLSLKAESVYDIEEIKSGWTSGEGYDFYYADGQKTIKQSLSSEWAWKNIEYFWKNEHWNPNGTKTEWVPKMKKIWFTEYGFPSVDCATNQPNVFYSQDSSESALPIFSQGVMDIKLQKKAILATELKWLNSEFVENKFLYAWDARPYPVFPNNKFWSDGPNWAYGHFLNGKMNNSYLADIIKYLCNKANLDEDDFDTSLIADEIVNGYTIDRKSNIIDHIQILSQVKFFSAYLDNGKIIFKMLDNANSVNINFNDIIPYENQALWKMNTISTKIMPDRLDFIFIDKDNNFTISTNQAKDLNNSSNNKSVVISVPIPMNTSEARYISYRLMNNIVNSGSEITFMLPITYMYLSPLDIVCLKIDNINRYFRINQISILDVTKIEINAQSTVMNDKYLFNVNEYTQKEITTTSLPSETEMNIIDIPAAIYSDIKNGNSFQVFISIYSPTDHWKGANIFYSYNNQKYELLNTITEESICGKLLSNIEQSSYFIQDEKQFIDILLENENNTIQNMTESDSYNPYQNLLYVNKEIIAFKKISKIGDNIFRISNLLRGRFMTQDFIKKHLAGDSIVFLDQKVHFLNIPWRLYNKKIYLKAVSFDQNISQIEAKEYYVNSSFVKQDSILNIKIERNNINDDIFISWIHILDPNKNNIDIQYTLNIKYNNILVSSFKTKTSFFLYTADIQYLHFNQHLVPDISKLSVEILL